MKTENRNPKRAFADTLAGRLALGAIIPLAIALAWWLGIRSGTAVVPSFGAVIHVLTHPFEVPKDIYSRSLAFSTMMTLLRLAAGFGLGVVTAVPMGILAGRNRIVDRIMYPAVQMARPINPVVLLPIATVLFGLASAGTVLFGELDAWKHDVLDQVQLAMVFILWWGAFFPVFISTLHGVRSVKDSYLETMRLMGAMLRAEGVIKTYQSKQGRRVPALDGLSFEAEGGAITCLLGPTGSGKTTVLRFCCRARPARRRKDRQHHRRRGGVSFTAAHAYAMA